MECDADSGPRYQSSETKGDCWITAARQSRQSCSNIICVVWALVMRGICLNHPDLIRWLKSLDASKLQREELIASFASNGAPNLFLCWRNAGQGFELPCVFCMNNITELHLKRNLPLLISINVLICFFFCICVTSQEICPWLHTTRPNPEDYQTSQQIWSAFNCEEGVGCSQKACWEETSCEA